MAVILAYCAQISMKSVRDINFSDLQDLPQGIGLNLRHKSVIIPNRIPGMPVSLADKVRSYITALNERPSKLRGSHLDGVIKCVTTDNQFSNKAMGVIALGNIPHEVAQLLELTDPSSYTNQCFAKQKPSEPTSDLDEEDGEDPNRSAEEEDDSTPSQGRMVRLGDVNFSMEDLERFVSLEDATPERLKNQILVILALTSNVSLHELTRIKNEDVSQDDDVIVVKVGKECHQIKAKCHVEKFRKYIRTQEGSRALLVPQIKMDDFLHDVVISVRKFEKHIFSEDQVSTFLKGRSDLSPTKIALVISSITWQLDLFTLVGMDVNTLRKKIPTLSSSSTWAPILNEVFKMNPDVNPFQALELCCVVQIGQSVAKCLNVSNFHAYGHARCFLTPENTCDIPPKSPDVRENQKVFSITQFERFLRCQKDGPTWVLWKAIASVSFCSGLSLDNLGNIQRSHFQLSFEGYTMTIQNKSALSKCTFIPFLDADPTICMASAVRRYIKLWDAKSSDPQAYLFQDQTIAKTLGPFEQECKISQVGIKVAHWLNLDNPELFVGQCFQQSAIEIEEEPISFGPDSGNDIENDDRHEGNSKNKIVSQEVLDRFIDLDLHSHYWLVRKALMCLSFCLQLPMESLRTLEFADLKDLGDEVSVRSQTISKKNRYFKPIEEYLNDSGLRGSGRGFLFKERHDAMFRLSYQPLGKKVVQTILDEAMSIYLQQELHMDFEAQEEENLFDLKHEDIDEQISEEKEDSGVEKEEEEEEEEGGGGISPMELDEAEETIKCKVEDGLDIFSDECPGESSEPMIISTDDKEDDDDDEEEAYSPTPVDHHSEDEESNSTETDVQKESPICIPIAPKESLIRIPILAQNRCDVKKPPERPWRAFIRSLTHHEKPSVEEIGEYLLKNSKKPPPSASSLRLFSQINAGMIKEYNEHLENHPHIREILSGPPREVKKEVPPKVVFFSPKQLLTILLDSTLNSKFWCRTKAMLFLGTKFERHDLQSPEFSKWNELCGIEKLKINPIRDYLNLLPATFQSGPILKRLHPDDHFGMEQITDEEMNATLEAVLSRLQLKQKTIYSSESLLGQGRLEKESVPSTFWWESLMKLTKSNQPTELDYLSLLEEISNSPAFPRNPWNHFRELRTHHKKEFGSDIATFPGLVSQISKMFQESLPTKKVFTIEEVQRFISLKKIANDPYWMMRQVAAAVSLCGQLHLFETKLLLCSSFHLTDHGVVVHSESNHIYGEDRRKKSLEPFLFMVPFDHHRPDSCMASCIKRYYYALPKTMFENPKVEFFLFATHKMFKPQSACLTKEMFANIGEEIARLLDLPNPELYAHGRCFTVDPTGYEDFFERTSITYEEFWSVQLNFPCLKDPPPNELCDNDLPVTEEELLKKVDTLGILTTPFGEPEKSASDYKIGWKKFLVHAKTSQPKKEHYLNFINHLRFERKVKGKAMRIQFAKIAHYHKKIYGTRFKDDHPEVVQIIDEVLASESSTGNGRFVKRFTSAELDYFLRMELLTDGWLMKKAAVCLIVCGLLSMNEIRNLNISDLLLVDEGYLVNLPRPRRSFIVPYNHKDPGSCQATIVKRYLDRIAELSEGSTEGPFLKAFRRDDSLVLDRRMGINHAGQICKEVASILLLPNTKQYWTQSFHPLGSSSQGNLTSDVRYGRAWKKLTDWLNTDNPREQDYLRYFSHLKYVRQLKVSSMTSVYLSLSVAHQRNCGSKIQQWPSIRQLIQRDDVCGMVPSQSPDNSTD